MKNSGFSIIKSVANLKISWSFLLEKILRSTRTLDCDKYRLKLKGRFFSFCWAIFLYFSTPISWVMIRNVINSTFCGLCAAMGWRCMFAIKNHTFGLGTSVPREIQGYQWYKIDSIPFDHWVYMYVYQSMQLKGSQL